MQTITWPNPEQDLRDAQAILDRHMNESSNTADLFNYFFVSKEKKSIETRATEWAIEIGSYFNHKYGLELGRRVTEKILTKFLLLKVTKH